jgi:hypothetical protein
MSESAICAPIHCPFIMHSSERLRMCVTRDFGKSCETDSLSTTLKA